MKRVSPTIVEIDLEALRFNYRQLRRKTPNAVKVLSVVKSNAYGHGAAKVARLLQEEGSDFFGVGTVDEGIDLREAGIKRPILILLGLVEDSVESLVRYQLTPVLYDLKTAASLNSNLARLKKPHPIHVKVDTGMTRLGLLPKDLQDFCDRLKSMKSLDPVGLMTHLADATDKTFTARQVKCFEEARRLFQARLPGPKLYHFANSQAVIDGLMASPAAIPPSHQWMIRPGIALYGAYPAERDRPLISLKPILRWTTRIVSVKRVLPKTAVSYGRTFTTKKEGRIGVLPVGYADGYPRILSNQAGVVVRGRKVPVVGTICMDMMMIDLTSVPQATVGDEVILIGREGESVLRAEDLAGLAQTISYEIFTRIAERIPRVYR